MVPSIMLLHESTDTSSPHSSYSPIVAYATMAPASPWTSGGLPSMDPTAGSSISTSGPRVHNAAGHATTNRVAYLRESLSSHFSQQALELMLAS